MKQYVSTLLCSPELDQFFMWMVNTRPVTFLKKSTDAEHLHGAPRDALLFLSGLHTKLCPDGRWVTFKKMLCHHQYSAKRLLIELAATHISSLDVVYMMLEFVGTPTQFTPTPVHVDTDPPADTLLFRHDFMRGRILCTHPASCDARPMYEGLDINVLINACVVLLDELFQYQIIHDTRVKYYMELLLGKYQMPPFLTWIKKTTSPVTHPQLWGILVHVVRRRLHFL